MKTGLYIFNTLMMILLASINNVQGFALSSSTELKIERYAVIAAWGIFALCLLITYLVWKRKSKSTSVLVHKPRIRTYEILDHGKRIVVTKKPQGTKCTTKHAA